MHGRSPRPTRPNRRWRPSRFGAWALLAVVAIGVAGLFLVGGLFGGTPDGSRAFPTQGVDPVSEAYSFAVEHPEVLRYLPCYCGCVANGHRNNEECFVNSRLGDGTVILDSHGGA